jgi:hypothetical protein
MLSGPGRSCINRAAIGTLHIGVPASVAPGV